MSLYDEQIRQRKLNDQDVFEESILRMASAVGGKKRAGRLTDPRIVTKDAIDDILKFYGIKPVEIPANITDPDEQLEYALRPHGFMHRTVELSEGWYKKASGPMIAYLKDSGTPVAVYPKAMRGYRYTDENGKSISISRKNAERFDLFAVSFYRPLPLRELSVKDLIIYMKRCLNVADFTILISIMLLGTIIGMMIPKLTRFVTGFVPKNGSLSVLWGTAVFIVFVTLSQQIINVCDKLASERIKAKITQSVESSVMMRVLTLPASFFKKYSSGSLGTRTQSMKTLCQLLVTNVLSMGLTSVISLLYITQIFSIAPALTLPALIIILTTVGFSLITTFMQTKITRQCMELEAKESGLSYAMITGIKKIKLAGAEKRAFSKWAKQYTECAGLTYDPPLFLKLNTAISFFISMAGTIALFYIAVKADIDPSSYIAFNAAYGMVMGAFTSLSDVALSAAQIKPILDMAKPILKTVPEVSEGREIVTRVSGTIELNNVCFRYNENDPYIINGLDLKINRGEYIAIVGRTGCGKSTLIRLLLGLEVPERGGVFYDGKDINSLDLRSLRRKIGTVTQDGGLFRGDIFSNIVISAPQLTLDDAWEAAEVAGIADDIRAMPMGMNTLISEGQGGISGGQKQRLMIARAIAPKPKILIFDEATSALDNLTQKQISQALDSLKCTRIVVAHRLSTIKNCDRILVLDKGSVVEDGTYDELIAKGGFFAELVNRQRLDN